MAKRHSRLPPERFPAAAAPQAIDDVAALRALLVAAAAAGERLTYSEVLARLGHRFTRPRMRLLCRTIGQVDHARPAAEPELGVLVVRASDGLPGSGWWDGRSILDARRPQSGPDAERLVKELQEAAFRHWRSG